jgi:hypothetical protein
MQFPIKAKILKPGCVVVIENEHHIINDIQPQARFLSHVLVVTFENSTKTLHLTPDQEVTVFVATMPVRVDELQVGDRIHTTLGFEQITKASVSAEEITQLHASEKHKYVTVPADTIVNIRPR